MFNQHAKWLKVDARDPLAATDRLAQLPALLARLAPGPQRLLPPGPGLHRPRRQQEGRDRPRLPAARRQLPAVGRRPLPAQPPLRQRDRRRQAAGARLPDDGRGDRALHARHRHLGLGVQRRRAPSPTSCSPAPATCRRSRRSPPPRSCATRAARPEGARRQRRRPDAPAARQRAPARALRRASSTRCSRPARPVIFAYHGYPLADPPPHLPAHQPRQHPRARLQGGGHDDDAVRHGDAQRPRPLPPRDRRDRPRPGPRASAPRTCARTMVDARLRHRAYTREHGDDPPEVRDWTWPARARRPGPER